MKKIIPIMILIVLLFTGCLRKPEEYKSMRNKDNVQTEQMEQSNTKPDDSKKPDETANSENNNSENTQKPQEDNQTGEKKMKVTADVLNMRSEMNKTSDIVTKLKKDDELKVIEEKKDAEGTTWVKVDFNGQTGFVVKEFLGE